ncbi:MAG: tRNA guanosine(34) transglycosylase Tgt [Gammaproteobacteria bacterium]|nr:tRNA guanosine(34) transglycosylase Tgt [Gammaproteobacteria bacterium]
MSSHLEFKVLAKHPKNLARVSRFETAHGEVITPVFMPVGTRAGVNNLTTAELKAAGSQMILGGNTYHMLCAPGLEMIKHAGGMHSLMGWNGPMLTDSGGFQVFSLSKNKEICTIDDNGAHFCIPGTNRWIHMTPEVSIEAQKVIGADVIMAFDQCTPSDIRYNDAAQIMKKTHRWLKQSVHYHEQNPLTAYGYRQSLFGIIQGGIYPELRQESAEFVTSLNLPGVAIGGETIGFDMIKTCEILTHLSDFLPQEKPRYSMGVGMGPQDLFDVVACGMDMFDCVAPTRNARHGSLYAGHFVKKNDWYSFQSEFSNGRLDIKKHQFATDEQPLMSDCNCYTCQTTTRSYLHHLFKMKSNLFSVYACIHNIHVMHDACRLMRELILSMSDLE